MSDKSKKALYIREFLNDEKHHGVGAILAAITSYKSYSYAELDISDCSRLVSLSFNLDCNDKEEMDNAIKKAEKLKRVTSEFCKHLKAEARKLKKRDAAKKKNDDDE